MTAQVYRLLAAINVESIDFVLLGGRPSSCMVEGLVGWGGTLRLLRPGEASEGRLAIEGLAAIDAFR